MSYSDFLSNAIKESGFSQRKISDICKQKYNTEITPSYISKLQNGTKTASKEMNSALAKACKIDPEDLQFEADFEKAPESVKKAINEIITILKNIYIKTLNPNSEDTKMILELLPKMTTRQFTELFTQLSKENNEQADVYNRDIGENILEKTDVFNNISMQLAIHFKMQDGSMLPIIQEGSQLIISDSIEINNGDIVIFEAEDNNYMIRSYIKTGNKVFLVPMNKKFETIEVEEDKLNLRGKVTGYITNF